jgi:hypothetical protein
VNLALGLEKIQNLCFKGTLLEGTAVVPEGMHKLARKQVNYAMDTV